MIRFCSLFSGSSGNSIYIDVSGTKILFDAGLSGVKIEKALGTIGVTADELSAVFVSHEHIDHVRGVGVLSRRYNLPVYANEKTWLAMESLVGKVGAANICYFKTGEELRIGEANVRAFSTPHDAAESVGFCVSDGDKRVAIATDIGHMTDGILNCLMGCELVLLESNHDLRMLEVGSYPYPLKRRIKGDFGHLSNDAAGEVAVRLAKSGTKRLFLGHLSQENNYPELAYITTQNCIHKMYELCDGEVNDLSTLGDLKGMECVADDVDIVVEIARRDCVSRVVEL